MTSLTPSGSPSVELNQEIITSVEAEMELIYRISQDKNNPSWRSYYEELQYLRKLLGGDRAILRDIQDSPELNAVFEPIYGERLEYNGPYEIFNVEDLALLRRLYKDRKSPQKSLDEQLINEVSGAITDATRRIRGKLDFYGSLALMGAEGIEFAVRGKITDVRDWWADINDLESQK